METNYDERLLVLCQSVCSKRMIDLTEWVFTVFLTIMTWLKRLLVLVIFLVLLVFFINFTLGNTQLVNLDLVGFTLSEVTLSTLVLVPFVLGGAIGLLVSAALVARITYQNKSLGRKLVRRDNEIQKLRNSALKGLTDA